MNFDQKLNTLMLLFKISNSKLSRGIDVDASLISRWKSGERKISPNSPHIPKLASYFLHLGAYHYQKEYLDRIIAARLPENERMDDASRIHVLADWLISAEPPEPQPFEQPEQLAQSVSLIENITNLLAENDQGLLAASEKALVINDVVESDSGYSASDWQPAIVPGNNNAFEIFEGRTGKRQAALNLLYQVLNSEQKHEILLTSEDDTQWLTEDRSFTFLWVRLLRQVIEKGHQITIIHVVNRRTNEIMNMLSYWMPLHMAGHMNSYYYPRYGDRKIRQTLFIVKGKCAVTSNSIADSAIDEPTFYYDDTKAVDHFTRLFLAHLNQCRPLFAIYSRENIRTFFSQYLDQTKRAGQTYSIRHDLNARLLPLNIVTNYLLKTQGTNDGMLLTNSLSSLQQDFINRLGTEHYVDMIPVSLLDRIQSERCSDLSNSEIFSNKSVQINANDTIIWLQKTIDTLRKYENYELFLCPENQGIGSLKINITYKENCMGLFAPANRERRDGSVVMLNENNILHSLSYYFDDFIQQIPTVLRSKPDVIQRLERVIASLETPETIAK